MLTLVTGGSGSGKSAFAEDRVLSFGDAQRIYIATMHPFDEESHKRIERHQKMRAGKGFETVECYTGLKNVKLPAGCVVLLECMSNLVANEMFEEQGAHDRTVSEVTKGIENLLEQAAHVVIVTNEIFSDAVVFDGDMDSYLEYLGKINQTAAQRADEVVEVVYGIPVFQQILQTTCSKFFDEIIYLTGLHNIEKEELINRNLYGINFKVAFAMFSKIPMPRADWTKENMKYMFCFFRLSEL